MNENGFLATLYKKLFSCISPCILCLAMHPSGDLLCEGCIKQLPWIKNPCSRCGLELSGPTQKDCKACQNRLLPYDRVKVLFEYTWPCKQLISEMKFKKKLEYASWFAQMMAQRYSLDSGSQNKPRCLIPVPLHPRRLQARGFNQAYLLAKKLGEKLNIPLAWEVVRKVKITQAQSSLSLEHRKNNLKDAFEMCQPLPIAWQSKVAIIDDVMTSGETVSALAQTLKKAGVQYIEIWCCCRALKSLNSKISNQLPLLAPILK